MKMLLLLFALILSANTFAQDDEEDFDSINPTYYLDSTYIKYKIKDKVFSRSTQVPTIEMLEYNEYIRFTTDEDLSYMISDSLSIQYHAKQITNTKKLRRSMWGFVDRVALDSIADILFVRVISPCQPCMNSIIDEINTSKELVAEMSNKNLKYVRVTYAQTFGSELWEFIFVDVKIRFKRVQRFNIYGKKEL
jgi:hypothetical protein